MKKKKFQLVAILMQIIIYSLRKFFFVFWEFFEQCSLGCTSFVRTVYKFPHCIILLFSLFFALHYFVIFIIFPVSALHYFVFTVLLFFQFPRCIILLFSLLFQFPHCIILLLQYYYFSSFRITLFCYFFFPVSPLRCFFYPNFFQFPGCIIFVIIIIFSVSALLFRWLL